MPLSYSSSYLSILSPPQSKFYDIVIKLLKVSIDLCRHPFPLLSDLLVFLLSSSVYRDADGHKVGHDRISLDRAP